MQIEHEGLCGCSVAQAPNGKAQDCTADPQLLKVFQLAWPRRRDVGVGGAKLWFGTRVACHGRPVLLPAHFSFLYIPSEAIRGGSRAHAWGSKTTSSSPSCPSLLKFSISKACMHPSAQMQSNRCLRPLHVDHPSHKHSPLPWAPPVQWCALRRSGAGDLGSC